MPISAFVPIDDSAMTEREASENSSGTHVAYARCKCATAVNCLWSQYREREKIKIIIWYIISTLTACFLPLFCACTGGLAGVRLQKVLSCDTIRFNGRKQMLYMHRLIWRRPHTTLLLLHSTDRSRCSPTIALRLFIIIFLENYWQKIQNPKSQN